MKIIAKVKLWEDESREIIVEITEQDIAKLAKEKAMDENQNATYAETVQFQIDPSYEVN
jgi:hypothetical protein